MQKDLELFEFALDHQLFGVAAKCLSGLNVPSLSLFPKALRRKMGDDFWDGIVDCYIGPKFRNVESMFAKLGLSVGLRFSPKPRYFRHDASKV